MHIFPSRRDLARRRWRTFGRPYLVLMGVAALIGLGAGIVCVMVGLLRVHLGS